MAACNASASHGPGTLIDGELAWTFLGEDVTRGAASSASVMEGSGMGWRIGAKHSGERLQSELAIVNTSPGFSNLSAPVAGGRFEARAKGNYRLDEQTRIKAEVLQTRDRLAQGGLRYGAALDQGGPPQDEGDGEDGVRYTGALLGIERDLGGSVKAEIGTRIVRGAIDRAGSGSGNAAGTGQEEEEIDLLTLRSRISSAVPGLPKANMYGEYEQDVRRADKRALALGYYEHRTVRSSERTADNETARIVSLHANVQPMRHWEASGRYAAKYKTIDGRNGHDRIAGHLLSGRITHDLSRCWDVGVGGLAVCRHDGSAQAGLRAGSGLSGQGRFMAVGRL